MPNFKLKLISAHVELALHRQYGAILTHTFLPKVLSSSNVLFGKLNAQ